MSLGGIDYIFRLDILVFKNSNYMSPKEIPKNGRFQMKNLFKFLCLSTLMIGSTAWGMAISKEQLDEQLIAAAKAGNLEEVQILLAQGASVDAKELSSRMTPLHYAAANRKENVCKLLIENKASLDGKDRYQKNPLWHAAERGDIEICKLLIKTIIDRSLSPDTIIAFLGTQIFHRSPIIHVDRHIMQLIAREACATAPKIKALFAQIDATTSKGFIPKAKFKLREYAEQLLAQKMNKETNGKRLKVEMEGSK